MIVPGALTTYLSLLCRHEASVKPFLPGSLSAQDFLSYKRSKYINRLI